MLKIVGALFVFAGSVGVGVILVSRVNHRIMLLRAMVEGLDMVSCELEFRMSPLKDALCAVSQKTNGTVSNFFLYCAGEIGIKHDCIFLDIWKRGMEMSFSALNQCDLETIQTAGAVLGRYDVESQVSVIRAAIEQLKRYSEEAIQEKKGKGKVFSTVSAAMGLFLIILLI